MEQVYDDKGKPQPEVLKKHFIQEGRVEEEVAIKIISQCRAKARVRARVRARGLGLGVEIGGPSGGGGGHQNHLSM